MEIPGPAGPRRAPAGCWRQFCRRTALGFCSGTGASLLLLGYTLLGAVIFSSVEGQNKTAPATVLARTEQEANSQRGRTVERLWQITITLNVLHKKNWTRLTTEELSLFQEQLSAIAAENTSMTYSSRHDAHWTFYGAFLYSLTVITTIGYGSTSPRTDLGKLLTMGYAVIGIPLVLIFLSNIGDMMARCFCALVTNCGICCGRRKRFPTTEKASTTNSPAVDSLPQPILNMTGCKCRLAGMNHGCAQISSHPTVQHPEISAVAWPFIACALLLAGYIVAGGYLLRVFNSEWSALDGAFFCFVSLSTVGFGELHPSSDWLSQLITSIYLVLGMALIAMCFSLMQQQVIGNMRSGVYITTPSTPDIDNGIS